MIWVSNVLPIYIHKVVNLILFMSLFVFCSGNTENNIFVGYSNTPFYFNHILERMPRTIIPIIFCKMYSSSFKVHSFSHFSSHRSLSLSIICAFLVARHCARVYNSNKNQVPRLICPITQSSKERKTPSQGRRKNTIPASQPSYHRQQLIKSSGI